MNPELPFQYCCLCEILIAQYMRTPTLSTSDGKHGHCCEECAFDYKFKLVTSGGDILAEQTVNVPADTVCFVDV